MDPQKLVVVGDSESEKTLLLISHTSGGLLTGNDTTVFVNYPTEVGVDKDSVTFSLFDMSGQEDCDRLRPLSYPQTDIVLLCFSVDSPASLESITGKWLPEVKFNCPKVPFVLVGNNTELRQGKGIITSSLHPTVVDPTKGKALAKKIGAFSYAECSAKTGEGVKEVFQTAARAILEKRRKFSAPLSLKNLNCFKWKDEHGDEQIFRLVSRVSSRWKRMGIQLGITLNDLEALESEHRGKVEDIWDKVMAHWLKAKGKHGCDYPNTWEGLYTLLEDTECSQVAADLKKAVTRYCSH